MHTWYAVGIASPSPAFPMTRGSIVTAKSNIILALKGLGLGVTYITIMAALLYTVVSAGRGGF